MNNKIVQVYFGDGKGKTTAAIGQSIRAASNGHKVIIIQFLKGKEVNEFSYLKTLEPDIKLFSFEKIKVHYNELSDDEKIEEKRNILNGFCFAKKVIDTAECDVLILDEVLGLVDLGIITVAEIIQLITNKNDFVRIVMTGVHLPKELEPYVDWISKIEAIKAPV